MDKSIFEKAAMLDEQINSCKKATIGLKCMKAVTLQGTNVSYMFDEEIAAELIPIMITKLEEIKVRKELEFKNL